MRQLRSGYRLASYPCRHVSSSWYGLSAATHGKLQLRLHSNPPWEKYNVQKAETCNGCLAQPGINQVAADPSTTVPLDNASRTALTLEGLIFDYCYNYFCCASPATKLKPLLHASGGEVYRVQNETPLPLFSFKNIPAC